ncbi:MAG: hypothetical protein CMB80_31670 [Flammeovirgaceae bacterium]|nr:hypothetical protein [Flammeovirgaceae bacterium]|tara:strand:+ start:2374 stop:3996 length:1623 start_codon:yes stop_codon:yes gene_type:complete
MGFIWRYLRVNLTGLIVATTLSTISGLGIILIMRNFHQAVKTGIDDPTLFFALVGAGLFTYMFFGLIAEKMLFTRTSRVIVSMRTDFCRLIFRSEYEEIESKKSELFSSLVTDINNISRIIEKLPGANRSFIISIGGIVYLVTISWQLSLIMLSFISVTYLLMLIRNKQAYSLDKKSRKSWDVVYQNFHDTIFGIKELSLNSSLKKEFLEEKLKNSLDEESTHKVRFRFFNHTTSKLSEMIMITCIGAMISLCLVYEVVTIAAFGEFLAISLFIMNPLSSSAQFVKETLTLKVVSDHIQEIGVQLENHSDLKDTHPISTSKQSIQLKNTEYIYTHGEKDHQFHLGPISLTIPANQITIIHGSNGSGKSTLSKIISGLYKAHSGQLLYGDLTIDESNLQSYRDKISAIFTDNHLFRTKKIQRPDQDRLAELLKLFEIDKAVDIVDNMINSQGLSSGQAKRLALVLSLIDDKEIYIFDEWAANQDPQFKKAFYYNLIPQLKAEGKTVILITHDDQYFDVADQMIHLSEGRLITDQTARLTYK